MKTAIKLEGVSKHFGKRTVVNNLSLETHTGEVFGFLGPNGAGKTTTIKMMVGMINIDEGNISICGADVRKDFEKAMSQVGAIVENPEMYKYMTGMQNLQQYARMLVGLSNRIQEKVSKYSLGMRQRLGVAQALLHHPKILILDEPTNGLDPAGIRQLRDILKNLAHKESICVLVSSHLMSEMQLMCDRVGIIDQGKLIQVKSVEELVYQTGKEGSTYRYHVDDAVGAGEVIQMNEQCGVTVLDEEYLEVEISGDERNQVLAEVNRMLIDRGICLYTAAPVETQRLEDAFIELTKGEVQIV